MRMPACAVTVMALRSMWTTLASRSMDTSVVEVGTNAVNECPEPAGRMLPVVRRMSSCTSASFAGVAQWAGVACCSPDQFCQRRAPARAALG